MANLLFEITSFLFSVFLISNAFFWLKLWEDKEYNWKRLFIHLTETMQGRKIVIGTESLIKWGIILLYGTTIYSSRFDIYYHFIVFSLYTYLFIKLIIKIYNKDFHLPTFSLQAASILGLSLFFEFTVYAFAPLDRFLWLILLDKLLAFIIGIFILIFLVFFDFSKDIVVNKAAEKLRSFKNLLTIAVVGSYAKGTTKEFTTRVLSNKFNVLETKTSFNTDLGIAKTILSGLSPRKQIFIAEMEDGNFGDIGEMSRLLIPKIAVVTGINDQKISIFGSLEKILDSKFQVVNFLPKDGIALFNANNENSLNLYRKAKIKKFLYGTESPQNKNLDIKAFNIKESRFSISFSVLVFGKKYKITGVKLLGKQNVENLLPAIFIGLYLGIDFSTIRKVFQEFNPLPKSMEPRVTVKGVTLINDTYNANINSVLRVLDYIKIYKGKKILVLEPLIELGKNAENDHIKLGQEIGKVCDFLFLTNDNYYKSIRSRIKNGVKACSIQFFPPLKIAELIEKSCNKNDVVIFEGHESLASFLALRSESPY